MPVAAPAAAAAKSTKAPANGAGANVFDFLGDDGAPIASGPPPAQPVRMGSSSTLTPSAAPMQPQRTTSSNSMASSAQHPASKPAGNGGSINFDDLWASSSGKQSTAAANKGKMTMAEMAKQKSSSAVWGASTPGTTGQASKPRDPFDFL